MTSLPIILAAVSVLLVFIALVEAGAQRLSLPQSIVLAALGILLGSIVAFGQMTVFAPLAALFADLPVSADALTLILLPPLLFDAALKIDTRRMLDDAAPIILLAVVAVCLSTFAVGFALAPLGAEPLLVCLLVGAIVSTTDPLAVLSIFRDVGAPGRLTRIVEGESLFNDAAAIALFTILLNAVQSGSGVTFGAGFVVFLVNGLGGLFAGAAIGFAAAGLMALTRHHSAALVSVTVALPYIAYVLCETALGISGAMAVVAAGLVTAARSRDGRAPAAWRHVRDIWEQLSFWSNSLIFVLGAFLVPRLLAGITLKMALATVILIAAAFAARAVVLWGFLPLVPRAALAQTISHRARVLLWWGGLRGALTLLLALSVTEHNAIGEETKQFIAVLSTAFVLFTILVNGLTLRPLTRWLGLHKLSAFDRDLGAGARALAADAARAEVESTAAAYGIGADVAASALLRATGFNQEAVQVPAAAKARLELALVVLAQAERSALSRHGEATIVSPKVAALLNREALRMGEAARAGGRLGYLRSANRALRFGWAFRAALVLQRLLGTRRPMSAALAHRFETLMVRRLVIREVSDFATERIAPVLGTRIADVCHRILTRRRSRLESALDALSLQYPHYAAALEQRFLERVALQREHREYRMLRQEGLIGAELLSALDRELRRSNRRLEGALRLDLRVDKEALVAQMALFAELPAQSRKAIAAYLRTRVVVPGESIIRRGERGDTVYFIASGAVEVDTGKALIRLGRGSVVGELAAFSGARRSADVTMLGYGELLVLDGRAFRAVLAENPLLRAAVEKLAAERQSAPQPALDATPGAPLEATAAAPSA
ncbi:cation:proton antiporter [Acuticoccus sp. MNP-M23]|uniref:cation:proton antiporter n=1 Tax=Acuticoccus sp. MNP-M23 TaxID=3072793 RepID=UPI0028166AF1|nr:cation:proton antiporter [Acuticoccus sp. MNP-M23]WMS43230.1 cation:proton antiporter [Acuticoccus sp. MNP-M23]